MLGEGEKSASVCVLLVPTCLLPAALLMGAVLERLRVSSLLALLEAQGARLLPLSGPAPVSARL